MNTKRVLLTTLSILSLLTIVCTVSAQNATEEEIEIGTPEELEQLTTGQELTDTSVLDEFNDTYAGCEDTNFAPPCIAADGTITYACWDERYVPTAWNPCAYLREDGTYDIKMPTQDLTGAEAEEFKTSDGGERDEDKGKDYSTYEGCLSIYGNATSDRCEREFGRDAVDSQSESIPLVMLCLEPGLANTDPDGKWKCKFYALDEIDLSKLDLDNDFREDYTFNYGE